MSCSLSKSVYCYRQQRKEYSYIQNKVHAILTRILPECIDFSTAFMAMLHKQSNIMISSCLYQDERTISIICRSQRMYIPYLYPLFLIMWSIAVKYQQQCCRVGWPWVIFHMYVLISKLNISIIFDQLKWCLWIVAAGYHFNCFFLIFKKLMEINVGAEVTK